MTCGRSKRFVSGRRRAMSTATSSHTRATRYTRRHELGEMSASGRAITATPAPSPLAIASTLTA